MKFKERLLDATSRIKMPFNGNQAGSEDVEIVDHIAAANADKTEAEIVRAVESQYAVSSHDLWGDAKQGIQLLATWGHARFYSVSNYLSANMVSQPLRIVGVLTLSLAAVLATSVGMTALVSSQKSLKGKPAVQSWIRDKFGIDYTTATTLSENKKAHARYGAWAYIAERRTGQAEFDKFSAEVIELASGIQPSNKSAVNINFSDSNPAYEGYHSQIWNANYNRFSSPTIDTPVDVAETGKVPSISAAGFWSLASNVDHLDKTGVLVTSDQSDEQVAAVFYNGQLSVNVLTNDTCYNVFGQPLTKRCQATDLSKTEAEFPVATLDKMFDRSLKHSGVVEQAPEVAKSGEDLLWYIRLPEAPKETTGLTAKEFDEATTFVIMNLQSPNAINMTTDSWDYGSRLSKFPKVVSSEGFFQNPEVVKALSDTAVVGLSDDKESAVIAAFVDGRVALRTITNDGNRLVCRVVFGKNVNTCSFDDLENQTAFLKSLYRKSDLVSSPAELAFYANAPFNGQSAHSELSSYIEIANAVMSDVQGSGFTSSKWQSSKQLKAQIPLRKAEGIFNDPQIAETLSKASAVFLADPDKKDVFALASNVDGRLQLDVFHLSNGAYKCVNAFGTETSLCLKDDLEKIANFPEFVKSMFNKKKED